MKKIISVFMSVVMVYGFILCGCLGFASGTSYENGDIIEYGNYPCTKVTDSDLISTLNGLIDNDDMISFEYFSGNGSNGSMTSCNFMKYCDIDYEGSRYRAVKVENYRPYFTKLSTESTGKYSYQDENGVVIDEISWFRFEPISWIVLDASSGLVLCENIIDSQAFNDYSLTSDGKIYGDSNCTNYACNYTESSIRTWLNGYFTNTAFTLLQKKNIKASTLDNSSYSTAYSYLNGSSTSDNVFLLSYNEITVSSYGFPTGAEASTTRQSVGTDYAKSMGLYVDGGYSPTRLRSPGSGSGATCGVNPDGSIESNFDTSCTAYGLRPAMRLTELCGSTKLKVYNKSVWISEGSKVTIPYEEGDTIIAPTAAEKTGYLFSAWSPDVPETMPDSDITFTAVYKPATYYVTLIVDGEQYGEEIPFTYGQKSVSLPQIPKKGGCSARWSDYSLGAGDVTITAIYTLENSSWNTSINTPGGGDADYKYKVKFSVSANNLPDDCQIVVYEGSSKIAESGYGVSTVSCKSDMLTGDTTFTAVICDKNGNERRNENGDLLKNSFKVTVSQSFFKKLVAFFFTLFKIEKVKGI